jgi:ribosomal protein S18 acetylase RimI-like enzyme
MRNATLDDIAAVLAFWRDATTEPSTTDDAASVGQLLRFDPGAVLLAFEGDRIVGSLIVGWDGWRGAMYRLAVAPSRRRKGIARALVTEGERRLAARGARRLHMIVVAGEAAAEAFWAAMGYTTKDQHRFVKNLA